MTRKKTPAITVAILLLSISILFSGCISYDIMGYTITITPYNSSNTNFPDEVETSTPVPTLTSTPTPTLTPTPTPTPEPTPRRDPIKNYLKIEGHGFTPSGDVEILVGDTVQWRNFEGKKIPRELISEDGVWNGTIHLNYMKYHEYTFNETGTFAFCLLYNEVKSKQEITVI